MIKFGLFDESEEILLKKCVIFYSAISANRIDKIFDIRAIDFINNHKVKTELFPVIRKKDKFDLDTVKKTVKEYIKELMVLTKEEEEFLERFQNNEYMQNCFSRIKRFLVE